MLTDAKLLELVYNSALCYIPHEQLDAKQLEKLDNITYRWCKCRRCQKPFKIKDEIIIPQNAGHANKKTLEICLSRPLLKQYEDLTPAIFLLDLIATALHEIVHVVYPEFNEDKTVVKTWEWLKRNSWVDDAEKFKGNANIDD